MMNQIVILSDSTNSDFFSDESINPVIRFGRGKRGGRLKEQVGYATGSVESFFLHHCSINWRYLTRAFWYAAVFVLVWLVNAYFFALKLSIISTRRPQYQRHRRFRWFEANIFHLHLKIRQEAPERRRRKRKNKNWTFSIATNHRGVTRLSRSSAARGWIKLIIWAGVPGAPVGGGHVLFFQGKTTVCNAARPRAQSAAVSARWRPCPSDKVTKYRAYSHLGRNSCQAKWKNSALTPGKKKKSK